MGKKGDPKVLILPSRKRRGTALSTSSKLDSPSVMSQFDSPQLHATSAESGNMSSREKIYLSKESMAMVKEAVALGRLLPPDASRDELRAYNKLAGELTKQTRQWRQAMEKQEKEELERQNSRRQPPRSDSPTRNKSKINR